MTDFVFLPHCTGKKTAWLNEADVEFFVGNSVGETSSAADDPEAAAVVQGLLKDCEEVVEDGQWDQLRTVLDRIQ
ncbi:hypothetical protein HaLaN_12156, partial [Haematococcus lacustris]